MRVLIVDDETGVLQALMAGLRGFDGHEVRPAVSAKKALEIAEMHGVDLLVTDVVMEPQDGFWLRHELLARFPEMRTIFISGYDLTEYPEQLAGAALLGKPVEVAALREAIRGELGSGEVDAVEEVAPNEMNGVVRASERPAVPSGPRFDVPAGEEGWPGQLGAAGTAVPAVAELAETLPEEAPVAAVAVPAAPRMVAAEVDEDAATVRGPGPSLLGQMIGGYQIVAQLGEGRWGPVYAAVQVAINRPVALKLLRLDFGAEVAYRDRFIADARAKANVQHPSVLSVFEAGVAEQWVYYAREYVDGQSLAEMAATGRKIDQPTALRLARIVAEGLLYFQKNTVPHTAPDATDFFLSVEGQPRLANLATQLADTLTAFAQEMRAMGAAILAILPAGPSITIPLRTLLSRTQGQGAAFADWEAFLAGIKALEPKVVPLEAAKISAQDRATVNAVARARAQQQRAFFLNVLGMLSAVAVAAFSIWYVFFRTGEHQLDLQVHIPGGDFISGAGTSSKLEEFWMDQYEVSVGQYAKFLEWIAANPGQEHAYDHQRQPRHLSHTPQFWRIYYENAVAGKSVHGVQQSLNSPVMMVTWWDAYAYAKWRGRELPTELEWERAARGTKGQVFVWGDEADPKRANTNADFHEKDPTAKAEVDGFNQWGDVDLQKLDKSPDGVFGLQGNVSEWTASWSADSRFPIIKGGNFRISLQPLSAKIAEHEPAPGEEWIGFRTISRTAPGKE